MKVHVTFFGGLKEEVGTRRETLDLPGDGLTVTDLVEVLKQRYPALESRLGTVALAVGDVLVGPDHVLQDGDEAALLPPVSGG